MRRVLLACWGAGLFGLSLVPHALSQGVTPPALSSRPAQPTHRSSLIEGAARGDPNVIEQHFAAATPNEQYDALWWAVFHGHLEIAELLLRKGVKPNPPSAKRSSALEAAARRPNVHAVELLCGKGADPNWRGGLGTALHAAVNPMTAYEQPRYHGHVAVAKALLRCGADPRIPKPHGDQLIPVLHDAVRTGDQELVQMILDKGVDINAQSTGWPTTALMWAGKHPQVVKLLLERGADASVRTSTGQSALIWAACSDLPELAMKPESIRMLVEAGAPLNDKYFDGGETALICAAGKASVEAVRVLAMAGADPNQVDNEGHTALGHVARANDGGYTTFRDGEDKVSISQEGRKSRFVPIVEILLAHGAKAELDAAVVEKARAWDPVGSALLKGLENYYVELARDCIERRPRLMSARGQTSLQPDAPDDDVFSPATVVLLDHLPPPTGDLTISPDGRQLYYVTPSGQAADVVVYDIAEDRADLIDADHSMYGRFKLQAGEHPCMSRSRAGDAVWPGSRRGGSDPAWSPVAKIRYELIQKWGDPALVAIDGEEARTVARHSTARVRKKWREWRKEVRREFGWRDTAWFTLPSYFADGADFKADDYYLSRTGQYLYYELLSVGGGGWFSPPKVSAYFVADVLAKPAKVWEIKAPVSSVAWHPNGRELFFIAQQSDQSGGEPVAVLAVARFP